MKNRVQTILLSAPVGGAAAGQLPTDLKVPTLDRVWECSAPAVDVEKSTVHYFEGIRWGATPSRRIGY